MPLIVSAPGRGRAGEKARGLVELVDMYPTLCELAGLPAPLSLEGTSFVPLLENPDRPWKSAAFSQTVRPRSSMMGRTMRTERYRFTSWSDTKDSNLPPTLELYDISSRPLEMENIANRPENAALVRDLTAKLQAGWGAVQTP